MTKLASILFIGCLLSACGQTQLPSMDKPVIPPASSPPPVTPPPPKITDVFPNHGPINAGGTFEISISGQNLHGDTVVEVNKIRAEVLYPSVHPSDPRDKIFVKLPRLNPATTTPGSILIRVINSDGQIDERTDLFTVDPPIFTASNLFTNQYAVPQETYAIVSADFNQDGIPDVATVTSKSHKTEENVLSLRLGTGASQEKIMTGTARAFLDAKTFSLGVIPYQPNGMAAGDLNGDTFPDLVVLLDPPPALPPRLSGLMIFLSKKGMAGEVTFSPGVLVPQTSFLDTIALGEFTGDKYLDLVAHIEDEKISQIAIYPGDGAGNFDFNSPIIVGPNGSVQLFETVDANQDGKLDLAIFGNWFGNPSKFSIWLNQGGGTFSQGFTEQIYGSPNRIVVGNFDGDGKPDFALNISAGAPTIIWGNGAPSSRVNGDWPINASIIAEDIDGDGRSDLVVLDQQREHNFVRFNRGRSFDRPYFFDLGICTGQVLPLDTDRDGRVDLLSLCDTTTSPSAVISELFSLPY